jgi:MFS superfamily sulfate permease-like transporter
MLGIVVLVAGGIQLLAGVFKLGQWFRAVSPAVIHGMLAGIGVLILASQFHVMVDDTPKGSGIDNLISIPAAIQKGLPWPEIGSASSRIDRKELLQRVGLLHEQQVQVHESIAELIPQDATDVEIDPALIQPLAERQVALSRQAEEIAKHLAENAAIYQEISNYQQMQEAAQTAANRTRVAHGRMVAENWTALRDSQAHAEAGFQNLLYELKNHDWAAKVGLLTIVVLLGWSRLAPKKLKLVPAPLVAIIVTTLVVAWLKLPVLYVEVPDNLWNEIHLPSFTALQGASWAALLQSAVVIALVASAETLLCAVAVDKMKKNGRTDYDRELAAQGFGNMLCGFMGALPMTGVIVRSSANIEAGGRTRLSAILHGVWLLIFVSLLGFMLRAIPTSSLAAMLVYIGYKLVKPQEIRELAKYGRGEVGIYFVTVFTIVATDLLTGVITGIVLSALKLLYTFSHLRIVVEECEDCRRVLHLEGAATFIRLPLLAEALESLPADAELHVELQHLDYIDHACLDLIMDWGKQHETQEGRLVIDWESLHARFGEPVATRRLRRQTA